MMRYDPCIGLTIIFTTGTARDDGKDCRSNVISIAVFLFPQSTYVFSFNCTQIAWFHPQRRSLLFSLNTLKWSTNIMGSAYGKRHCFNPVSFPPVSKISCSLLYVFSSPSLLTIDKKINQQLTGYIGDNWLRNSRVMSHEGSSHSFPGALRGWLCQCPG